MKDGKFEVGDEVECVEDNKKWDSDFLNIGEKYKVSSINTFGDVYYLYVRNHTGNSDGGFYPSRFKLSDPSFQPEYFSALNEKDAEKYVDKVMEFADRKEIEEDRWVKGKYCEINLNNIGDYAFVDESIVAWQFMRTCPETFQTKKVKKTVECWMNIYPEYETVYKAEDEANLSQERSERRIACVKLTGEYEVEED